jgi:hypothetical protein
MSQAWRLTLKQIPEIWDANQHEKLIERLQDKESKWRYRPVIDAACSTLEKQTLAHLAARA